MLTEELTKLQNISKNEMNAPAKGPAKPDKNGKRCMFMNWENCHIPYTPFSLCKTCPYGYIYCFSAVVQNVYKKIVGIAVFFVNSGIEMPSLFSGGRKDTDKKN